MRADYFLDDVTSTESGKEMRRPQAKVSALCLRFPLCKELQEFGMEQGQNQEISGKERAGGNWFVGYGLRGVNGIRV